MRWLVSWRKLALSHIAERSASLKTLLLIHLSTPRFKRGLHRPGVPPGLMGIGPAEAIPVALKKAGLEVDDVDIFEINEVRTVLCPPEPKVRTPAHTRQLGWYLEFESRVTQCVCVCDELLGAPIQSATTRGERRRGRRPAVRPRSRCASPLMAVCSALLPPQAFASQALYCARKLGVPVRPFRAAGGD